MDKPEPPLSRWKAVMLKYKQKLRSSGDANEKRIFRRRKVIGTITSRLTFIKIALFLIGYSWMLLIPSPFIGRGVYIDENALQPGQVNIDWNWGDVHTADQYLAQVENLCFENITAEQRAEWMSEEFSKLGISSSTQRYSFTTSTKKLNGTNAYAVLSAPRHSGTEAMVIGASWISRIGEEDGTVNIRGVSTVLALANFLKRYSYWGKDIVFVISDGYLDGMQAWLAAYHDVIQVGMHTEPLELTSGVIWTALNIDYPGHSFSHLGMFFEGLNGRLPNQDLMNSFARVALYTVGIPVVLYDHVESNETPSWLYNTLRKIPGFTSYLLQARNVARHLQYQVTGQGSGIHGIFHRFRIDAITLFAVPATGPHGFHSLGRTIEGTLRTMNNLLERLHASFFFYIMTGPEQFLKIGLYIPSAIFISIAMMFHGLSTWVDAAWVEESISSKQPTPSRWRKRRRPVIPALCIMIAIHLMGALLFKVISSPTFAGNQAFSPIIFLLFSSLPLFAIRVSKPPSDNVASISVILKALNICLASTVISIITLLNFSLAATLSVLLGFPLVASSFVPSIHLRLLKYAAYSFLGLGWLLVSQKQMMDALWNWQVLSVWFAPFVCIVYVPLVIQAGIICLIPS
ncbi:hypothetical protein HYPSUDRAFT_131080 [Hypholoma sublateritium FD-334 SS-4]|uniref:Gaa1-domain-containing protein n=1 Tax=Hypholoma sublateritium (strain FD-334 SS-4) TaxID=945553 RepID=A0A0D2MTX8_HYPSF|nr:hypothetical protein HYPSUDRAFT_131080 [Hypholoma sublateritium FD-334 SS-4]